MSMRDRTGRACVAVLRDGPGGPEILMVQYRTWWTLPGGGVQPGESAEHAALRELREETGLAGQVVRLLFSEATSAGHDCHCFLVRVEDGQQAALGSDPELPADGQHLHDVRWFPLADKKHDRQVSQVIRALSAPLTERS